MRLPTALAAAFICLPGAHASAQSSLPNPWTTPGATNPAVTQANIDATICKLGWTRTVRPPRRFVVELEERQLRSWWSYAGGPPQAYEEDHLIPLELGGAPADPHNLWPEPRDPPDGWGASRKDGLERVLNRLVCTGQLPLVLAQRAIAREWRAAYRLYVR